MDRLLFAFGLLLFAGSFIFFIMNFFSDFDGIALVFTLFGMLNAGIAMGVAEILSRLNTKTNS
ncbi:hypothetical protein [Fredinandcohnia sp. 179-A 10B2 NHS]|uniref:hypothetical protein n=1 Tax=Fredinandcohnia sp. 179-A 10B2 NHS TaxID=3235176 RepID=UPI0039A0854A